jgi:hypothetical protein
MRVRFDEAADALSVRIDESPVVESETSFISLMADCDLRNLRLQWT